MQLHIRGLVLTHYPGTTESGCLVTVLLVAMKGARAIYLDASTCSNPTIAANTNTFPLRRLTAILSVMSWLLSYNFLCSAVRLVSGEP